MAKLTRKQIKYFGTARQRAALKAGRKRGKKKRVGAVPHRKKAKRKAAKRKSNRRRVYAVAVAGPKRTKRRKSGINGPMKNIGKSLITGAAAFGGGYASSYIDEALEKTVEDPNMRAGAVGLAGLLLVMVMPTGPVGAAGVGIIGGAGRGMADAPPVADGVDPASVRGVGRRRVNTGRTRRFRAAVQHRLNGDSDKYHVVTGMPDDRSVITGPGQRGANYPPGRNRF